MKCALVYKGWVQKSNSLKDVLNYVPNLQSSSLNAYNRTGTHQSWFTTIYSTKTLLMLKTNKHVLSNKQNGGCQVQTVDQVVQAQHRELSV